MRVITASPCAAVGLYIHDTYINIFYFSNPENTHKISTRKDNKKNSGAVAKEGHNAS